MGDDDSLDGVPRSRPSTPRASTGGASLAARYLSQPQRIVGCSLPPLTRDADTTARTRGFVTLAVPHILESAATTQSLPETTLVRFRWKHEESARGSLFQPAKITDAPGLLLQRRTARQQRQMAGGEQNADDSGEDEESKQHSPTHASTRPIEMMYPICVDVQRLFEYLRDMVEFASLHLPWKELVLDVIDRNTRGKYGKCVIPLFNDPSVASIRNSHSSQEMVIEDIERVLRQLRRDIVLYEIKPLGSDDDGDIIGYLAVKLDVQIRGVSDTASLLPSNLDAVLPPAPVLIPRTRLAVHVNVHQPFGARDHKNGELHHGFQVGALSPISYLESDAFHSLEGSSPRSEGMLSSLSSLPRRSDERTHEDIDSPTQSSKLHHLIKKGKALQKLMAKATEDGDDDWYDSRFPVPIVSASNSGAQEVTDTALQEDLNDSVGDHDPRSWQSILKQAQIPSQIEQKVPHNNPIGLGKAAHSRTIKATRGLKITFEALKFTSDFIDQLQQMRDSAISSRFSPIEMAISHSNVSTLLISTTEDSVNQVETTESLFTITPSLRNRTFRLTYSHVVPLQPRGNSSTPGLISRSSKKQLQFFIACKAQGAPHRLQQSSRNDKKNQIVLRGEVSVHDFMFDQVPTPEPKVVNVSVFIREESGSAASRLRRQENAHRVGVLRVKFQHCTIEAENSKTEIKDGSHLIFSSPPSSRESVAQSSDAPNSLLVTRREMTRERSNPTLKKTRKRLTPTLRIATQLAVMIDKASSVCFSKDQLDKGTPEDSFIRFEYAIPPSSSTRESSQPVDSFKRSFRRKLIRVGGLQNCSSKYHANVGHIGVFPLELDQLLIQNFKKKLLIIEVWLQGAQHAKDDEGELLGLVKIPFSTFSSCFRESSIDWDQDIPFVGVDDRLPVEDPFSGHVSGFLQIRIAIGTAEQIITLTSSVRAIVQLQAIVRGVLCRKENRVYREAKRHSIAEGDSARASTLNVSPDKVGEDDCRNHTIPAAKTEVGPRKGSWEQFLGLDNDQPERYVVGQADDDLLVHDSTMSRNDFVHEIRLEIRECWRSAEREYSEMYGAWKEPSSVIGCEVQGKLLLGHDQMNIPNEGESVQFALWWDASHSQLNSHFEHSFRSKDRRGEVGLLANEVKFAFQVQTDFIQSSSSKARKGKAVLNLQKLFGNAINPESLRSQHVSLEKDIDMPIEWEDDSNSHLCRIFPVRVCYRVSSRTSASHDQFQPILPARSPRRVDEEQDHSRLMTTTSTSTTRRLLPATITLSIHVLSVADLKHAIEEKWSQVCASSSEKELKKHLEGLLTDGAASVIFECNACLGVEIAESAEERIGERGSRSSHLYKQNERWYKKFRFPTAARCPMANTQQLLSNTLTPLQLKIIVHPEAMLVIQNECLDIRILSWCPRSNAEYQIGAVSVPIAAVLFRPSGVQGAFPISIGDVLSGRLGVHVHIDHYPDAAISNPEVPAVGFEEREREPEPVESIVHRPVSPTSPDEIATDQHSFNHDEGNQPIQVTLEDFRNLQYKDDEVDGRGVLFSIEVEYFDGEGWLRGGKSDSVDVVGHFHQIGDTETRSLSSNRIGGNPTLRIGVCYGNGASTADFVGVERLTRSTTLIGWCLVDLSLLQAGWREIHGWYHIFDGQQISRGQVKVKASLSSGVRTIVEKEGSFSATQHLERRERELARGLNGEGNQEPFRLGFGMFSDTPRDKDVDESRNPFSLSAENVVSSVNSMSEMSVERLESIKRSNHWEESITSEQIDGQTGDQEDEVSVERGGARADFGECYDRTATMADDAGDHSPVDCYFNHEEDLSAVSDDGDDEIDEATRYYKPITLSSFGIEEIQLSPLSDHLSPSPPNSDRDLLTPAEEKYDEQVMLNELDDRQIVAPISPTTLQTPLLTPDDLEEAFVDDLLPLSATSHQEEFSGEQDIETPEDAVDESDPDRISDSSVCHQPDELDSARRAPFFAIEELHGAPNDSCTTSVHIDEGTRSFDPDDANQDSDHSDFESTDLSLETPTNLLETSNSGDADDASTISSKRDTFEDEEMPSLSVPNSGFTDVSGETHEKSTQVNMESCTVEGSTQGELIGAEEDGDHAIEANSDVVEDREQENSAEQDLSQPELLYDRMTKKEMVDVGCGTADNFDHVADQISTPESYIVIKDGGETSRGYLESNEETAECSYPRDDKTLEADDEHTDAPSGDLKWAISTEMQLLHQQHESTKQSSFNPPADKFELICQLLTEIRDSCGSGLVKEILQAHNTQIALNERQTELFTTEEHFSTNQEGKVTPKQNEAEAKVDQVNIGESVPAKSHGEEPTSSSQKLRQSRDSILTKVATENDSIFDHDYKDRLSYSSDVARGNPRFSPTQFSRRDLKVAYWSDSSTLQQEMQRRLAVSDAGQDSRNADYNLVEMDGKSNTGSRRDLKLFGDEIEAQTPALFAFRTRQMKKPFSYKADSETERIARIMQGSVNYWRKGDEHTLTSDDDSVDSFGSDDEEDCYF